MAALICVFLLLCVSVVLSVSVTAHVAKAKLQADKAVCRPTSQTSFSSALPTTQQGLQQPGSS